MTSSVKESIKIATYNVLKPVPWFDWIVQTEARYNYQLRTILPSLEADIICLNEVTESYARLLEKDQYLTATYQYSPLRPPDTAPDDIRVVILSKTPIRIVKQKTRNVVAHLTKKNVVVVAAHLQAYEGCMERRKQQLENIDNLLQEWSRDDAEDKTLASAIRKGNVLLLGDLNLHLVGETENLWDLGYKDLWLEKYFHEDGYTWDPNLNGLIANWLLLDNRRMRLDRICIKASEQLKLRDIKIFANRNLPNSALFPSDHFGLLAELDFVEGGARSSDIQGAHRMRGDFLLPSSRAINLSSTGYYGAPMPSNEKWTTGFRTITQIVAYRTALLLLIFMTVSILGWKILGIAL